MIKSAGGIASVLLAGLVVGCAQPIDSGEELPAQQAPLPNLRGTSTIAVAASISLSRLQAFTEDAAPRTWEVDKKLTALKIKLRGTLERGPIALAPTGQRIGFGSPITGHGSAPLSWVINGALQGSLLPQIGPDYRIASNLELGASLSEARLKLALLPDISLRGKLEELLASEATSIRERLDRSLNKRDKLRSQAERLWKSAHGVTRLNKKQDSYLLYRPTAFVVSNPSLVTAQAQPAVIFGLGVTAEVQLVHSATAPSAPVIRTLPPATIRPIQSGQIALSLPLIADPATLAATYTERLKKKKLKLGSKRLRIIKIEAAGQGTQLLLKCRVRDERWWRPMEADLFITGMPYLDAVSRTVRLRDPQMTLRSRNALLATASFLMLPLLTQTIGELAVYPLAKLEEKGQEVTDRWAVDLAEKSQGAFQMKIASVRVEAVSMQSGYMIVETSAAGTIVTNIEPLLTEVSPKS